jgi:Family of unknown function (DUF5677)
VLTFDVQQFPVVTDQSILAFCFQGQRIRTAAVELMVEILRQALTRQLNKEDLVVLMLLNRLVECLLSFELLLSRGRERDAGVLLVTLIELRLDLCYLNKNPSQAQAWIDHDDHHRKPWKVSFLIDALHTDQDERAAAKAVYEHCSMVKHGNPAGGILTFPIGIDNRRLVHRERDLGDFLAVYTFSAVGAVYEGLCAAANTWLRSGFDTGRERATADEAWKEIQALNCAHVNEMVSAILSR